MNHWKKILVGVDVDPETRQVSRGARQAVEQARSLSRQTSAQIVLLHSTHRSEREEATEEERRAALGAVEALRDEVAGAGHDTRLVVAEDPPWLDIIRCVLRGEADAVMVGRRTYDGPTTEAPGVLARRLQRKCPAPVWVVDPDLGAGMNKVLAATDLSEVGARATRYAAHMAQHYGAELHVVHAYALTIEQRMEAANMSDAEADRFLNELVAGIRAEILEGLATEPGPEPHLHIGRNAPSRAILACLERLQPELLVMGTLSRVGLPGLLVGNTAERLLDRVPCSLLTIKPKDFVSPVTL